MNTFIYEPFDAAAHRQPHPDEGGRVPEPFDVHLAQLVIKPVPHGISAWEARRDAGMLPRPRPDLPAWDERAHLAALATSIAPGPPLNMRRRRTPLWKRITDWLMAGLP